MAQAQFNPEPGRDTSTAAPHLTVAPPRESGGAEGLSLRTLIIAALASAAAAIVTSAFWKGGTVVSAAVTPVIVAIVKEIVERPRDVVRRASAFTATSDRFSTSSPGRLSAPSSGPGGRRDTAVVAPIRTYGRPARRRIHLKVALVTGLVAFLIAAVVLTVPELVFGGSVATKGHTTLFGGKARTSSKSTSDSTEKAKPDSGQAPAQTPPGSDGQQQPDTQSQQSSPQTAPQDQPPAQQAPAPAPSQQPAPAAPAPTP